MSSRQNIGHIAVSLMLLGLISFHLLHLAVSWKNSRTAIITAEYGLPLPLALDSSEMMSVLVRRLESDEQYVAGFVPLIYLSDKVIHVNFASRGQAIEATLQRLAEDLSTHLMKVDSNCTPPKAKFITLKQWSSHFNSWIRPLDVLVLVVLIGALFGWVRTGKKSNG